MSRRLGLRYAAISTLVLAATGHPFETTGSPAFGTYTATSDLTGTNGLFAATRIPIGSLTAYSSGNFSASTNGTLISGLDITNGRVITSAANISVLSSRIQGPIAQWATPTTNTAMVECLSASTVNCVVWDVTFAPQTPSVAFNAMLGHDFDARRNDSTHCVDDYGVYNTHAPSAATNVSIQGCYGHERYYFTPDANHSDNHTHNDFCQMQGGSGTVMRGNNMSGYVSATVGNGFYPRQKIGLGAASAGTLTLTYNGHTTTTLNYNDTITTIQAAVNALTGVSAGDITVTGYDVSATTAWPSNLAFMFNPATTSVTIGTQPITVNVVTTLTGGAVSTGNTTYTCPYYPYMTGQCITGSPNVSAITGCIVDQNDIDGGSRHIVFIQAPLGAGYDVGSFTSNRFTGNTGLTSVGNGGYDTKLQLDSSITVDTVSGNTLNSDGSTVTATFVPVGHG